MVPLFPFLFPPPLRVGCAGRTVPEWASRRCESDLIGRHDVAVQHIQQLPEPFLRPHIANLHEVGLDPHVPPDERGMRGGEQWVDVDSLAWIDWPIRSVGLALQQLPEPQLGSHFSHQRGINPHPLSLAHGWLMLMGQLLGNSDGVERIDHDPLHV
ncbi:MAG TPA: hypothetical protein VIY29_26625, partial [Ktedonobacteraceae bacterium]